MREGDEGGNEGGREVILKRVMKEEREIFR